MEYIKVTKENLEKEHIYVFDLTVKKHCGTGCTDTAQAEGNPRHSGGSIAGGGGTHILGDADFLEGEKHHSLCSRQKAYWAISG